MNRQNIIADIQILWKSRNNWNNIARLSSTKIVDFPVWWLMSAQSKQIFVAYYRLEMNVDI